MLKFYGFSNRNCTNRSLSSDLEGTTNIMKTSATQFEMLVNYMEQHGDINKPSKNARGRLQHIENWEALTNLLNSDATGEIKTTEKWKKVWSDLKNNTKKKAAKINRAARGTGGGPALQSKLTELEERVLTIMGPQAATGLAGVVEAGFCQVPEQNVPMDSDRTITLSPTTPVVVDESPSIFTFVETECPEITVPDVWNLPGTSLQPHVPPPAPQSPPVPQLPPATTQVASPSSCTQNYRPAQQGRTPRRSRGSPLRRGRSPRRRLVRPETHIEEATQHFLSADEEWRSFLKKKHADEMEIQREMLRIREMELVAQQSWQDIARCAISTLESIARNPRNLRE